MAFSLVCGTLDVHFLSSNNAMHCSKAVSERFFIYVAKLCGVTLSCESAIILVVTVDHFLLGGLEPSNSISILELDFCVVEFGDMDTK